GQVDERDRAVDRLAVGCNRVGGIILAAVRVGVEPAPGDDAEGGKESGESADGGRIAGAGIARHQAAAGAIDGAVPIVDLPPGASEDRAVGALDLEAALTQGIKRFEPGLLARANRGFLYIDEINLLEDHIVDLLLDVAASGENVVEREGLSVRHPARVVLVGSGNPEEGELRPQLLDRFGLSVEVRTPSDLKDRIAVVKRRDAFDRDATAFAALWAEAEAAVMARIAAARALLPTVTVDDDALELSSRLCLAVGADGLRGELTMLRAARATAALDGDDAVDAGHLIEVAAMALRHRLRRNPLDDAGSTARIDRAVAEVFGLGALRASAA
ncbi:MAG: ATP-binding protein, partial [Sphingomonadaceae bacterium]|nr:ATP-binding protein [Sphingomonadaceae bacterium]